MSSVNQVTVWGTIYLSVTSSFIHMQMLRCILSSFYLFGCIHVALTLSGKCSWVLDSLCRSKKCFMHHYTSANFTRIGSVTLRNVRYRIVTFRKVSIIHVSNWMNSVNLYQLTSRAGLALVYGVSCVYLSTMLPTWQIWWLQVSMPVEVMI